MRILTLIHCPRCELNFIPADEELCSVCKKQVRGIHDDEVVELCIECGIRPAMPGDDLCRTCIRDALGRSSVVAQVVLPPDEDTPVLAAEEEDGEDEPAQTDELEEDAVEPELITEDIPDADLPEDLPAEDLQDDELAAEDEDEDGPANRFISLDAEIEKESREDPDDDNGDGIDT